MSSECDWGTTVGGSYKITIKQEFETQFRLQRELAEWGQLTKVRIIGKESSLRVETVRGGKNKGQLDTEKE